MGKSKSTRRRFLEGVASAGGAAVIAAPYIRNANADETTVWKVQTSCPAGVGLASFKEWCGT
ncbi:MAG: twin-arginine translocation signal domain-containing protein, partial [Rhodoplanes sp.]